MARYYAKRPNGDFIAWDELDGESTEATRPLDLGLRIPPKTKLAFLNLGPGEWMTTPNKNILERHW
jgi:hypothetical protein